MALKKGEIYNFKVTDIVEDVKFFNGNGGTKHKHSITFEDKSGAQIKAEYLTNSPGQKGAFVKGVIQYFRVLWEDEREYRIEPCDEPPKVTTQSPTNSNSQPQSPTGKNCYNLNISGSSIAFAMAYAKDIKSAEIARQPEGYSVSDRDIEDMCRWGDMVNKYISNAIKGQ